MVVKNEAFVTLVTNDDYGVGALVLGHSLRDNGTTRTLVALVTEQVSALMQGRLADVFDEVITVSPIHSRALDNLALLGRPELYITFTKFHVWNLTQFAKIVFLDADTLVLTNVDDLFQYEEFSACSDIGWPDCFNSGVFVARPSAETFQRLIEFGESNGSFDGGDQGLLNEYFADWKRLPFVYNVTPSATYSYAPAYKKYQKDIRIAHFIGVDKPWRWERYSDGTVMPRGRLAEASGLVQFWWNVHDRHIGKWGVPLSAQPLHLDTFVSGGLNNVNNSGGFIPSYRSDPSPSSEPLNPFFRSRYDWSETELGQLSSVNSSKGKLKSVMNDDEEERALPLKKSPAASSTVAATQPAKQKAPAKKK